MKREQASSVTNRVQDAWVEASGAGYLLKAAKRFIRLHGQGMARHDLLILPMHHGDKPVTSAGRQ